jgi:hypothetical protein
VVNQETGLPGAGLRTVEDLPVDREQTYRKNWFALPPVQIVDFKATVQGADRPNSRSHLV